MSIVSRVLELVIASVVSTVAIVCCARVILRIFLRLACLLRGVSPAVREEVFSCPCLDVCCENEYEHSRPPYRSWLQAPYGEVWGE